MLVTLRGPSTDIKTLFTKRRVVEHFFLSWIFGTQNTFSHGNGVIHDEQAPKLAHKNLFNKQCNNKTKRAIHLYLNICIKTVSWEILLVSIYWMITISSRDLYNNPWVILDYDQLTDEETEGGRVNIITCPTLHN